MPGSFTRSFRRSAAYILWTLALLPAQIVAVALQLGLAERIPRFYHRGVCRFIGLDVARRGEMSPRRPTLFVCNHTSYLDITVLGGLITGCFVAKREVADWPFYGLLAKLQRSVFVTRRRGKTGGARDELAGRLDAGDNLILFPEGTSNDGNRVLPFKSALFSVAERRPHDAPLTVQPVSIAYSKLDGQPMPRHLRPLVAWYGDMELVGHLWRLLGLGTLTVEVTFHPPVTIEAFGTRKALATHCHATIAAAVSAAVHGTPPAGAGDTKPGGAGVEG